MGYILTNPPEDERSRELWIQHAAGFIVFKDMRNYAIGRIPADTDDATKEKILKGIDDTLYGLMMMMDGVSGGLRNEEYSVNISTSILLIKDDKVIQEINTLDGDGMCMGFHGWKEGDFGEDEIVIASKDH